MKSLAWSVKTTSDSDVLHISTAQLSSRISKLLLKLFQILHNQHQRFLCMDDFNAGFVNGVDMAVSVPACSFDSKLAAACDELLVFQHIDKSTHF